MAAPKEDTVLVENADIIFRNFAGREGPYNSVGDRNFCLLLDRELEQRLRREGWNVKELKAREEGDTPRPYIQVTVNYKKGRPPRCVMITSRGRTDLGADEVEIFDYAEIKKADIILNPYSWDVNGNHGIKAYLKTAFVTINEDELELKYADMPGANDPAKDEKEVPALA